MPIKAIVEKLDDVAEQYRDLYTEKGGKFELTGVEGMKTQADVDRLSEALRKEKNDHKVVRDRMGLLGDRKIEDVLSQLDRIPELETAASGKIDEEKLNGLVEGRLKARTAPLERDLKNAGDKLLAYQSMVEAYATKDRNRAIADAVRAAAVASKVLPEAMDDALMLAERIFEVSDDGQITVKDDVGFTPGVGPAVWLTDIQAKRPHWWAASMGGGGAGNRGGGSMAGDNPWSHTGWNMTKQGTMYRENPDRAAQMAKAAGTTIGGLKPPPKTV